MEIGILISEVSKEDLYHEAQDRANEIYKKVNGEKKAGLWVCSNLKDGEEPHLSFSKVGKCYKCGGRICYNPNRKKNLKESAKKICAICLLKYHREKIPKEQLAILERGFN